MKQRLLTILIIFFTIVCCETEDGDTNYFDLGKTNEFRINEDYVSGDKRLKFSITDINDSRCPVGVYCIWQGEVEIKIVIEKPNVDTITLSSYDQLTETFGNYEFELDEVIPYPDINEAIEKEDYFISLKISRTN